MKTNTIKKYKWYIFCAIAVVLIMSIGLSFCAWDDNGIKNLALNGGVSDYKPYNLVTDSNNNLVADVGDIVTYGNYYQTAEATSKDPIRWIVVHKEDSELTLLAENLLAFGNFWNRYYYTSTGNETWEDKLFTQYYQNYMASTLSMWLNSDYSARHDKGVPFTANNTKLAMRGFMNEAFTKGEIANINSRTISGIQGMAQGNANTAVSDYGSKTYKVWVPSWSEIYGSATYKSNTVKDGNPNTQFEYFKGVANVKLIARTTAFASTPGKSNYTTDKDTSHIANARSKSAGEATWWWLRSPHPSYYPTALAVDIDGVGGDAHTNASYGGVRPAICIPV